MKILKLLFSIILLSFSINAISQVNIIFDTDLGGDVDDLGALTMLHHFVDKKECNLLGVMCWSTEQYAVSAIDAVNRYYKHPDIPIGVRKAGTHHESWCYSKPICDKFDYELTPESAEDAIVLYRKLLAGAKDKSVTIVTVGPLKNIENLINSKKDAISKWSGMKLIRKKVKEFVVMGGQFPEGKNEWNFNHSLQKHGKIMAVAAGKFHNEPSTVKDIERGGSQKILPYPWQGTLTFSHWFYKNEDELRHSARTVIEMLFTPASPGRFMVII